MSDLREAAEQALEDICEAKLCEVDWLSGHTEMFRLIGEVDWLSSRTEMFRLIDKAAEALRQALAQPEQEPVAWFVQYEDSHEFVWSKPDGWRVKQALEIQPLYTAPPKKEWVGLSDEEIYAPWPLATRIEFARWVEAKLKEKNGG